MIRSLRITNIKDRQTDFIYWSSRSVVERLQAIETLRQQYINFNKDVQPRLQRVYSIINRK